MPLMKGSILYTQSGRKRKVSYKATRTKRSSGVRSNPANIPQFRRETEEYPSVDDFRSSSLNTFLDQESDTYKHEISSKYTVAPAFNKGAYQVISKENIKDIGK